MSLSYYNDSKFEVSTNEVNEIANNDNVFEYIPTERIDYYKHVKKQELFDSAISVGYENADGSYTVYIFSSPIL